MAAGTSGINDPLDRSQSMSALLAQNWWAVALRGVFAPCRMMDRGILFSGRQFADERPTTPPDGGDIR